MENDTLSLAPRRLSNPFYDSLFDDETVTQRKGMLSRTEKISGFQLKVSRHERELYEEFCNSAEAELLREIRDYFIEAKEKAGVINIDRLGMWSKTQNRIDLWLREACIWRHLNPNHVPRAREAIWHRVKDQLAKTIRETLGAGVDGGGTLASRQ